MNSGTTSHRTQRGRPPDARKHAAILQAAQSQFLAQGYAATSMADIANVAMVSKLTIYRHFSDKAALFGAALSAKCRMLLADLDTPQPETHAPRDLLERTGRAFLDLILDPDALAVHDIIAAERLRSPALGALFYEHAILWTRQRIGRVMQNLVDRGTIAGDHSVIADDFIALLSARLSLHHQLGIPSSSIDERKAHIAHCADVILAAYGPRGDQN